MKNKKADINVTLIVFFVITLFLSMLFIFIISKNKIERNILEDYDLNNFIKQEENLIKFYLSDLVEETIKNISLEEKENENFENIFEKNFKIQLEKYSYIDYVNKLNNKYRNDEIEVSYNQENKEIEVIVKNYRMILLISYEVQNKEIEKIEKEFIEKRGKETKIIRALPYNLYKEKMIKPIGIEKIKDIKIIKKL
ncbi:MAG: hypothetical protein QW117_01025 [Candidatus Pacearchaeota archaeon]